MCRGIIHRYQGSFDWEGVSVSQYPPEKEMKGVSVRWLISPAEETSPGETAAGTRRTGSQGSPNFALRYFEIEPGGWTALDQHAHDHGVVVLRGRGRVLLGDQEHEIAFGDVVYIPPCEMHQLRCAGEEPFGFLCVIPQRSPGTHTLAADHTPEASPSRARCGPLGLPQSASAAPEARE